MLRLLSWSSGLGADKAAAAPEISVVAPAPLQRPDMDTHTLIKKKRKRVDLDEGEGMRGASKRRVERMTHGLVPKRNASVGASRSSPSPGTRRVPPQLDEPAAKVLETPPASPSESPPRLPSTTAVTKPHSLGDVIQSQIGLEILVRHNELRLIEQEIAKCQIALEQLRRCTEIPYPGIQLSRAVADGKGPALRSAYSVPLPQSPAPWGVTDGPYSRHYAKWLIPDPAFDGGYATPPVVAQTPAGKRLMQGRSTRGSFPEMESGPGSSRRRGGTLQALSNGYPQPKDRGHVIQKRKSDGKLVKLVCLDCGKDDCSSAQGFINHCRISHNRNFASHDAAAEACGRPVEVDEAGAVLGGDSQDPSMSGLIHPLVRTAHLLKPKEESRGPATPTPRSGPSPAPLVTNAAHARHENDSPMSFSHSDYKASPLTPHLSAFIQSQGLGLNLSDLVADAKTEVPRDDFSDEEDESVDIAAEADETEAPFPGRHPPIAGTRQVAWTNLSPHLGSKSANSKSITSATPSTDGADESTKPLPASSAPTHPHLKIPTLIPPRGDDGDVFEPSPTNESNQAPSLVDDDEDYEAPSPSSSESVSEDLEEGDVAFEVQDDESSGPSTRSETTESDFHGAPKVRVLPEHGGRPSAFRRRVGGREEKHVSFVSPSPVRELKKVKKGGGKRRRN